jgi:hypothetical protein
MRYGLGSVYAALFYVWISAIRRIRLTGKTEKRHDGHILSKTPLGFDIQMGFQSGRS